jgi:putative endonuclease
MKWCVYILECADGSLYTGITNNIKRRLEQHGKGAGAKYTRGRLPVTLLYSEKYIDRASAARREAQIKKLSRLEKIGLTQA